MDKLWEKFTESGKISDYLKYIGQKQSVEKDDDVKRTRVEGTQLWGKR